MLFTRSNFLKSLIITSLSLSISAAFVGCSKKSSGPKKPATSITPVPTQGNGNASGGSTIRITEASAGGTSLYVNLNQTSNFRFTATGPAGETGQITNIVISGSGTAAQKNGADGVTITPKTQADLTGTIQVSATAGTYSGQETFYWQSSNQQNGGQLGGLSGLLGGLFSMLMSGNFNFSSMLNLLFQNLFNGGQTKLVGEGASGSVPGGIVDDNAFISEEN